jgi:hypothetical protein
LRRRLPDEALQWTNKGQGSTDAEVGLSMMSGVRGAAAALPAACCPSGPCQMIRYRLVVASTVVAGSRSVWLAIANVEVANSLNKLRSASAAGFFGTCAPNQRSDVGYAYLASLNLEKALRP